MCTMLLPLSGLAPLFSHTGASMSVCVDASLASFMRCSRLHNSPASFHVLFFLMLYLAVGLHLGLLQQHFIFFLVMVMVLLLLAVMALVLCVVLAMLRVVTMATVSSKLHERDMLRLFVTAGRWRSRLLGLAMVPVAMVMAMVVAVVVAGMLVLLMMTSCSMALTAVMAPVALPMVLRVLALLDAFLCLLKCRSRIYACLKSSISALLLSSLGLLSSVLRVKFILVFLQLLNQRREHLLLVAPKLVVLFIVFLIDRLDLRVHAREEVAQRLQVLRVLFSSLYGCRGGLATLLRIRL
mmetsp:Transcript_56197/g.100120  ORF Transcript_56197/g.100120 Transcript_56197/m.100120 type:complete len:296 (+) Transcript_56197:315-1202(+)